MSETTRPWHAGWRGQWLKITLLVSLALNLLFVGAGVARYVATDGAGRPSMSRHIQLVPRKFLAELEGPRRDAVLQIIRGHDKDFREGRRIARAEVLTLADALESEPYDAGRVAAAIDAFAATSTALVREGGDAALGVITALSAPERKLLARQLRMREARGKATPEPTPGSQPQAEPGSP